MEILEYDPFLLKDVIESATLISDKGFSGAVFFHDGKLIKLHKRLYQDLKVNSRKLSERRFNDVYRWDKRPFVEKEQIEYLCSIQSEIHLTDFDKGIVLVNDQICGTILTEHLDYQDLTNIEFDNPKRIIILLRNILASLKELEDHEISHLDLAKGEKGKNITLNILYKNNDIKLCDVSGKFLTYKENFDSCEMYREYMTTARFLLEKLVKNNPEYTNLLTYFNNELTTYDESVNMVDYIEKKLK